MSGAGSPIESQTANARTAVESGVPQPPADAEPTPRRDGRFDGVNGSLRSHTARGTIVNSAFQVGLAVLLLLRRVIVAAFLTATEFGLWGVMLIALLTVMFLKDAGIGDKFVQQDEPNQEHAFQKAFTIDLLLSVATMALAAAALPLFASAYGKPQIVVPGLVLSTAIVGNGLQSPAWIYYRRMDFVRQRSLQAVEPVVTFVVTVALAIAGMGYWCLVIGAVAGTWTGGLVALRICPYPVRLRLERRTLRDYFGFSWPIVVASGGGIIVAQGSLLVATRAVGLAAAGAIGLASAITAFSEGIDTIVSRTLYPAICAVRDRMGLMFEAFEKSNRVALMWGVPFGLGVALFAPDLVHFVIGDRWHFAIPVIQAFGLVAAADQLGFNWTIFLRALDRTRPLAVLALLQTGAFLAIAVPLMIVDGLDGFALGWMIAAAVTISARMFLLARLFSGFRVLRHAFRGIAPVLPAAAAIGLARALEPAHRTLGLALAELALYVVVVAAATWTFERPLIRELIGYLRRRATPAPSGA